MATALERAYLSAIQESELQAAYQKADFRITKDYLRILSDLQVVPFSPKHIGEGEARHEMAASDVAKFFHVDRLVFDSKENNLDKLTSVYSAAASIGADVALILDSDGKTTDLYMEVCNDGDGKRTETLYRSFSGNFQGSLKKKYTLMPGSRLDQILNNATRDYKVVSSVSGIGSLRSEEPGENIQFTQGIEKMIDAAQGKRFTALILAKAVTPNSLMAMKAEYEHLYSALVPFAKSSRTLSETSSISVAKTLSNSFTDTMGSSKSSSDSNATS